MMAFLYLVFVCNTGGACAQANDDAIFSSPQECLHELPQLYYGALHKDGKFYLRDLPQDTWLECVGARGDDGRIVASFDSRGHKLPPPPPMKAITDRTMAAERRLQQFLIRLEYQQR